MKYYAEQANKLMPLIICLEFKFISSTTDSVVQNWSPNSGPYFLSTRGFICIISGLYSHVCRTFYLLILLSKNIEWHKE